MVSNFEQLLSNVFLPLFEATVNPQAHLNIHKFLQFVSMRLAVLFPCGRVCTVYFTARWQHSKTTNKANDWLQ